MLWVVPALALCACILTGWVAARSGDRAARVLALGNLFIWALANAGWYWSSMWTLPVTDWFVGIVAMVLWWERPAAWIRVYINLIAVRLILHVLDTLTGHAFFVSYIHALNATYAGLVVAAAYPGIPHGFRTLLLRVRSLGSHLSASPKEGLSDG